MANFRPLQPAPLDQEAPPQQQQPQSRPLLAQKPKRTVTLGACVACRKRKSKCDGQRPNCTCCSQKDTDCVYELGPNEKPSQAMKRKNEEMQGELAYLRQLYDFLRLRPEEEAMHILRKIRDKPAETSPSLRLSELADLVRHGNVLHQQRDPNHPPQDYERGQVTLPSLRFALDSPSNMDAHNLPFPGILSMESDCPPSQRRRYNTEMNLSARSGNHIVHPPPASTIYSSPYVASNDVPIDPRLSSAKDWTTVTADSDLLVTLLSAWTEREYSYYHYLDRESFLDDMNSSRTDFCSPLLVNALLASACFHSSVITNRHLPFTESSLATKFYKEAQSLWDLEAGTDSLTKLQAGICLFLVLGKLGRDKIGQSYLVEACQIGLNLGLFSSQSSPAGQSPSSGFQSKWDRVRAVTAWTLFNFQVQMSTIYALELTIKTPPPCAIPYDDACSVDALFRSECAKYAIFVESVNAGKSASLMTEQAMEACYSRLTHWWTSRSPSIQPDISPSKENLLCAMIYHVNILDLFRPLFENDSCLEYFSSSYLRRARSIKSSTLKEMRRLLALQETRYGWADAITLILHPITVVSFGSLEEISFAKEDFRPVLLESSEPYLGLLTCLRALDSVSSYSYYAQPLFRLLSQKCQALGLQLPTDIQSTLDYYTTEEWTKNARVLFSSKYVAGMRKTVADAESARMDDVISRWADLSLNEASKSKARPA